MQMRPLSRSLLTAVVLMTVVLFPSVQSMGKTRTGFPVDESALRYYASQNNRERVDAEIRRLKTLHPGWNPPQNLYKAGSWINPEKDLWELFASDQLGDLRAEIERRRQSDPNWRPSTDLLNKLALKEARARLVDASEGDRDGEVVRLVESHPLLLNIEDLEVLWRVAKAYSETGAVADAVDLYLLPMRNGSVSQELKRATAQQAVATLPLEEATQLLRKLREREDSGFSDVDIVPIARQIARRWIAGYLDGNFAETPPEYLVEALEGDRTPNEDFVSERLLAWYDRSQGRHVGALKRFDEVLSFGPHADAAFGRILSLEALNRYTDALAAARQLKGASPHIQAAFVRLTSHALLKNENVSLTAEDLGVFAQNVRSLKDTNGALILAWYAYRHNQMEAAAGWFSTALGWGGGAKAAEGHIWSVAKLTSIKEAAKLQSVYAQRFPEVAAIRLKPAPTVVRKSKGAARPSSLSSAYAARKRGNPQACLSKLASAPASSERALLKGWCLLDLNRPEEAARSFGNALGGREKVARDAAYGRSLALLRVGRTFDAIEGAQDVPQPTVRRHELASAALAQTATTAFRSQNYQAALSALDKRRAITREPRDLMLLRGWALYYTGHPQKAAAIFSTLDQQLSTRETRSALEQTKRYRTGGGR